MERLLIPLSVKAMLVGTTAKKAVFSKLSYQYEFLSPEITDVPVDAIEPDIMSVTGFLEGDRGIYLHFSLPDTLTKGAQREGSDEVEYPAVANRWLITRMWTSQDGTLRTKCFIIEGDVLQESSGAGFYNLKSASYPYPQDELLPYRYIGRTYPGRIAREELPAVKERIIPLRAVAPANPCFAAFLPDCCNVFGFFDDLKEESGEYLRNIKLSYMVCGWYDDEREDILAAVGSAAECKEKLFWKAPEQMEFPAQVLCHGLISDIGWIDENTDYSKGILYGFKEPELAIGNTSMEALAAYEEAKVPKESLNEFTATMLLCGAKHRLKEGNGLIKAMDDIHKARFGCRVNIGRYAVKEKAKENQDKFLRYENKNREETPLESRFILPLKALNLAEEELFCLREGLKDKQEELYDLFYKYVNRNMEMEDALVRLRQDKLMEQYRVRMELLSTEINNLHSQIVQREEEKNRKEEQLIQQMGEDYRLTKLSDQSFWEPNDPVLMLFGLDRDYSRGADVRFSDENIVLCRSSRELISQLTLEPVKELLSESITVGAEELFDHSEISEVIEKHKLPLECIGLIEEGCLLSPGFSGRIAACAADKASITQPDKIKVLEKMIRRLQTAPVNGEIYRALDKQSLCRAAGFDGIFPEIYAISYWKQPWNPLYLCWQLTFYPDPKVLQEEPGLEDWILKEEDYIYQGDEIKIDQKLVCTGRSVVTPYAAEAAAQMMKEIVLDEPLLQDIRNMSILSQKLNGFHDKLLMKTLQLQVPITLMKISDTALKNTTEELLDGFQYEKPEFNKMFMPIRAGFLELNQVNIVDDFGQTIQMKPLSLIAAKDFRYTENISERFVLLPPRVLQPLRLNFEWLNRRDTPICGWLLPNHIEKAVHCYSSEGELLGSLQTVPDAEQPVVWKLPPDQGGKTAALSENMDEALHGILETLLRISREEQYNILDDFLAVIDTSLWNINPSANQLFQELGLYVGKPLAIVRSALRLELLGRMRRPKTLEKSEKDSGKFSYPHIEKAHFQVRVGRKQNQNDGLIGFFKDSDYTRLHLSASQSEVKKDYFCDDNTISLCPGAEERPTELTLLMDSAGCVDLVSAILPVKSERLEENLVKEALSRMYLTIFTAPFLTDVQDISIPIPKIAGKQFHWLSFDENGIMREQTEIHSAGAEGFLPETPFEAIEGWLKLRINGK